MKNLYVYDLNNELLFNGSKHDCKAYIRKNRVSRYRLTENFIPVKVSLTIDTDYIVKQSTVNTDSPIVNTNNPFIEQSKTFLDRIFS